jgi:hypothetical protein
MVGELFEPMGVPPVQGVEGALSLHSVQLIVPVGGPPTALPESVAVSPQVLPTVVTLGGRIAVVRMLVAALTLKHSTLSGVPAMLSLEAV